MSRINRFLLSKEWEDHFTGIIQVPLPGALSDHCPIKLFSNRIGALNPFASRIASYHIQIFLRWQESVGCGQWCRGMPVLEFPESFRSLKAESKLGSERCLATLT